MLDEWWPMTFKMVKWCKMGAVVRRHTYLGGHPRQFCFCFSLYTHTLTRLTSEDSCPRLERDRKNGFPADTLAQFGPNRGQNCPFRWMDTDRQSMTRSILFVEWTMHLMFQSGRPFPTTKQLGVGANSAWTTVAGKSSLQWTNWRNPRITTLHGFWIQNTAPRHQHALFGPRLDNLQWTLSCIICLSN